MCWGLASVQVKCTAHLQLEQSHLEKVDRNTLGKNWFRVWIDPFRCDIPIINQLEELYIDVVVGHAEGAGTS